MFRSVIHLKLIFVCHMKYVCVCILSRVLLFVTPRTIACCASLSKGLSRQEYCSELPFRPPDLIKWEGSKLFFFTNEYPVVPFAFEAKHFLLLLGTVFSPFCR